MPLSPKIKEYGFIFIIPSLIIILALFIDAATSPYWLRFDPTYAYLLNGLNLLKGLPPVDVFHPGTPLQMLCAAVYWILNISQPLPKIVENVLTAPEFYLHAVHAVLLTALFASSALVSGYLYHKTRDKIAALLVQLPLIPLVVETFAVSPDPLIIITVNLFNLFFFKTLFADSRGQKIIAALGLSVICGLGIASKLIFLPLALIPFFILDNRSKLIFAAACPAAFVLFTLPIMDQYPRMLQWFSSIAQHTGIHGIGKAGLIDWATYTASWKSILINHYVMLLSVGAALLWACLKIIRKTASREARFLAAAALGLFLQFGVVAKSYEEHYLLPGIILCALVWPLFYLARMSGHKMLRHIAIAFILLFSLQSAAFVITTQQKWTAAKEEILAFDRQIRSQYPGCTLVGSYPAYSQEYALSWGNANSRACEKELSRLYPDALYFDNLDYTVLHFEQRAFTDDLLAGGRCIIFMDSRSDYFKNAPYTRKLLARRGDHAAYLLTSSQEKAAENIFNMAHMLFIKEEYPKALAFALKAREMNYQPREKVEYFLKSIVSKMQQ